MIFSIFKTIFSMFVIMVILSSVANSQTTIGLGIESGINIGDIGATPTFNTTSRTGLMVGGFADIGVTNIVSIRPGVRFTMKGFSSTFNGVPFTDKLSYLEIPMMLKVNLPLNQVKPFLMAGPTLGIQLSASEDFGTDPQSQGLDANSIYETIDFGLYFGGGIDFHIAGKTELFTTFGYSLGLTNISKLNGVSERNHGFQVASGVKFNL